MDKIAIVGTGQTRYERKKRGETFSDLVYEVTVKALDVAGLSIEDIDNVVTVSNDFFDGRTISSMAVQDSCGSRHKDISTVEGDGIFGAFYGGHANPVGLLFHDAGRLAHEGVRIPHEPHHQRYVRPRLHAHARPGRPDVQRHAGPGLHGYVSGSPQSNARRSP